MIRQFAIASILAAGYALPTLAAETPTATSGSGQAVHARELANLYDAKQAHNILASRGFVNVSALDRDEDGHWVGTATKDGKTIFVSVILPKPPLADVTN